MRVHSLRPVVSFGLVALALMANGRMPIAEAQTAPPASPSVALSASPTSAQAGQSVTLKWSSTNAASVTLEPSVGPVAAQGSTTVRPSQSTTYTVTAKAPGGSAHASAQVTITSAPPQAAVQKPSQEDISSDQQQMRGLDEQIQALRKGGVQRIYVGNVATGDHKLDVLVDGKLEGGADFSRTGQFTFRKEVKPRLVGLTLAGPRSGNTPITLGDW